jgi:hypothetical protein
MTRKEEIKQAGINYTLANKPRCIAGDNFADVRDVFNRNLDFEAGAKWADEHPKQIEISLEDIEELAKEVIPDDWVKRQMAMKWLRELYKISIEIYCIPSYTKGLVVWRYMIRNCETCDEVDYPNGYPAQEYLTFEEAVEAALKYCLTKLI